MGFFHPHFNYSNKRKESPEKNKNHTHTPHVEMTTAEETPHAIAASIAETAHAIFSDPKRVLRLPVHEQETTSRVVLRGSKGFFNILCGGGRGGGAAGGGGGGQSPDWSHRTLAIDLCWREHDVRGAGVRVAVLDTGVDRFHEDLSGGAIEDGNDFTGSQYGWSDFQGHGTHCAGVIAARDNDVGIVGVAPESTLLIGKVLGDDGSGTLEGIAAGIDWAVSKGVDVISMSLGGDGPISGVIRTAIDAAIASGAIVVVAAGNSGMPSYPPKSNVGSPGNYNPCVTVGACDQNLVVATFSSRGPEIDVVAPGVDIVSCIPGQRYAAMSGTSMATPLVAGLAALWIEKKRKILGGATTTMKSNNNQREFERYIRTTAMDLGRPGFDTDYGAGLVQPSVMLRALEQDLIRARPPPPAPTPAPPPSPPDTPPTLPPPSRGGSVGGVVSVTLTLDNGKAIVIAGVVGMDVHPTTTTQSSS